MFTTWCPEKLLTIYCSPICRKQGSIPRDSHSLVRPTDLDDRHCNAHRFHRSTSSHRLPVRCHGCVGPVPGYHWLLRLYSQGYQFATCQYDFNGITSNLADCCPCRSSLRASLPFPPLVLRPSAMPMLLRFHNSASEHRRLVGPWPCLIASLSSSASVLL